MEFPNQYSPGNLDLIEQSESGDFIGIISYISIEKTFKSDFHYSKLLGS